MDRTGPKIKIVNPATEELVEEIASDTNVSVVARFESAKKAQRAWTKTDIKNRMTTIEKFKTLLDQDAEKLAEMTSLEMGKPVHQALGEIKATLPRIQYFLDHVEEATGSKTMNTAENLSERITFDPLGVIANISAWNFPYFVGTNVYIPALLTGNAVLYKPSEITARTGLEIEKLMHEAGVPQDIFQCVIGEGPIGAALLDLPINGVFFTGSYGTGRRIAEAVAGKMIKTQLELGGKDGCYVMEDVDVAQAATATADGAFYNVGQSCCAVERLYVHERVYDQFLERFVDAAREMKVGDPSDKETYLGALARKPQIEILETQVKDAQSKGGRLLLGGKPSERKGYFFETTVIADANEDMLLMRDESFGPVIGIQKVSSDEEAVERMNDTEFGLTNSVYGTDTKRVENILSQLNSGTVYQNMCDRVSPFVPWTGRQNSGMGSTLSLIGIEAFTQPKSWQIKEML